MPVEIGEYNGHQTILLKSEGSFPVSICFGIKKAQLILENIDEIKKFVENDASSSMNIKFHQKK